MPVKHFQHFLAGEVKCHPKHFALRVAFNLYILTTTQQFDVAAFRMALEKTTAKRKTTEQMLNAKTVIERIAEDKVLTDQWGRYQNKYGYAADVSWEKAINALLKLALAND